ncbi:MAG TPA: hypothetical protein VFU15_13840, partial [Bacteroidia bacterium]|nr:hypothetical protein [Bacteroidia bacterium]
MSFSRKFSAFATAGMLLLFVASWKSAEEERIIVDGIDLRHLLVSDTALGGPVNRFILEGKRKTALTENEFFIDTNRLGMGYSSFLPQIRKNDSLRNFFTG